MFRRSSMRIRALSSLIAIVAIIALIGIPRLSEAGNAVSPPPATEFPVAGLYDLLGSPTSMGDAPPRVNSGLISTRGRSRSSDSKCGQPHGWLRTQGSWIVETDNPDCKVRLAGVTWYGMESTSYALAGLNTRTYTNILKEIAALGFNSIRIPLSDQLVKYNSRIQIASKWLKAQTPRAAFKHLHPLGLLDKIVTEARSLHLMVILDNHFSKARAASKVVNRSVPKHAGRRRASETTWASDGYTEKDWINDWVQLAKRYKSDPNVIGFDLRNEPHTDHTGKGWTLKDYVTRGATWGKCTPQLCDQYNKLWKKSSNWVTAAEAAGNAVQKINPNLLLFVEGTQLYPSPTTKAKVEAYWWGSILKGVLADPVKFNVPNHLVYSPHEWGPWKCCLGVKEFNSKTTYASLAKVFEQNWAFILNDPKVQAPIWLGEFNTCNSAQPRTKWTSPIKKVEACVKNSRPGTQGQWFHILITFLQKNPEISWSYYPINGTNMLGQPSNNSVLNKYWRRVRLPALMTALRTIEKQPS